MTLALRDMVAHAEAYGNTERADTSGDHQSSEAHKSKRRRVGASVDVVGAGLRFFAHQRSVLFPGHREQKRSDDSPGDTIEQLQNVLQQLESYQPYVTCHMTEAELEPYECPSPAGEKWGTTAGYSYQFAGPCCFRKDTR